MIDELLEVFKTEFGDLTITRGKKHKFLAMTLSITDDTRLEIEMKDQIEEAFDMFG